METELVLAVAVLDVAAAAGDVKLVLGAETSAWEEVL